MKKVLLFTLLIALFFSSCSLVKNQKSVNFARVKYNSHLKLGKQQVKEFPKTAESFIEEKFKEEVNKEQEMNLFTAEVKRKEIKENSETDQIQLESTRTYQVKKILQEIKELEMQHQKHKVDNGFIQNLEITYHEEWWNDDIEDWPWLEIALAVIAVLVIGIIVALLVNLLGGIISTLIGLILLVALAYILYTLWIQ